jgi:hypothetical protein
VLSRPQFKVWFGMGEIISHESLSQMQNLTYDS